MNSRGTLLGNGFVPNLVRLVFLLVILAFFFGSMISLWGTSYQWLAIVIGAFLLGTVVSLLFFRWKTIAFFTLGFLISNFTGAYIAHQQGDVSEARAAYVGVAGRDPAYAALFPDPLNAKAATAFQTGRTLMAANASSHAWIPKNMIPRPFTIWRRQTWT